mmetsp:Transcript_16649/g.31535  ORF Transcript_16649/g.31535 Transcript_16649/m.31535 type:complete len:497 (+) Transcript_16649:158-1648(+)|eukprot:CAMPEP_0176489242 /NCGR_PEP_ID=MMETSP0200_2-20121128/7174_1 /TAXON_ID=947934 /ORGANISM="Chaetoceros sp., Strain GSL56" /LENGTH=496 /DNA_ID=CAMNT_0017886351 /DNA_START=66 /DNA_END=1556 /DNA_ORIENTATION=+
MNDSNQQLMQPDIMDTNEEEEENFVREGEAVEVEVNDDDVPMEDDDEDDEDGDADVNGNNTLRSHEEIPDLSFRTIEAHNALPVYAIASHYDRQNCRLSIITGGGDDKACFHQLDESGNVQTTQLSHVHSDSVSCVATNEMFVSNDMTKTPKFIAVGGYDGTTILYDPESAEIKLTLDGPTDVEFLSFHPKGGSVLLAGSISDGTVWMYHLPTSKCLQVFVGHECNGENGGVTAGSFTPDGKFALTVGMDGTMRLWAPRTGMCKHVFRLTEEGNSNTDMDVSGLICLALDGDVESQLAMAGGDNGRAYIVHLQAKKLIGVLRHFDTREVANHSNGDDDDDDEEEVMMVSVEAVGFAPKGVCPNWVATGGSDGVLKIWDLSIDSQCRQSCIAKDANGEAIHTGGVTRLSWHPTLPVIFASYTDGAVRIWDARNGNLIKTLTCGKQDNQINDLSIEILVGGQTDPANTIVITAHDDGTAKVFRVDTHDILSNVHTVMK